VPTIGHASVFKLPLDSCSPLLRRVRWTFRQSLGALHWQGFALTYTVGRAVIYRLLTQPVPFMRTPKMDETSHARHGARASGARRGDPCPAAWVGRGAVLK